MIVFLNLQILKDLRTVEVVRRRFYMKGISANDLFMNVFNFSAIGMAIVSFDGKMMKVNSSLCKGLGYSKIGLKT